MNFPLEVVAEQGKLQKALGLPAIEKTATHEFPKGKVTIRTNRLPTTTEVGAYTLYYSNPDSYRAVCSVTPMRDWSQPQNPWTKELYYVFTSGCIRATEMDAFVQTIKMIEEMVSRLLRKEPHAQED